MLPAELSESDNVLLAMLGQLANSWMPWHIVGPDASWHGMAHHAHATCCCCRDSRYLSLGMREALLRHGGDQEGAQQLLACAQHLHVLLRLAANVTRTYHMQSAGAVTTRYQEGCKTCPHQKRPPYTGV